MYDIVGKRNLWFAISAILTIPGLIFIFLGGLRPSIDFTGGNEWEVRYEDQPTAAEMRDALSELDYPDALVTELPNGFLRIRTEPIDLIPPGGLAPLASPSASASASAAASASASAEPSASASASPSASASASASPSAEPTPAPIAEGTEFAELEDELES